MFNDNKVFKTNNNNNNVLFIEHQIQLYYSGICFYIIIFPTRTRFNPAHTSTPEGAYNKCCRYRHIGLLRHTAIKSSQVLILWMSEPVAMRLHCGSRASNLQPFGYESYALTHCAITAQPKPEMNI